MTNISTGTHVRNRRQRGGSGRWPGLPLRAAQRAGIAGIVAFLAATTMAACSGSSSAHALSLSDPKAALSNAIDKTVNVDSARVSLNANYQQQGETAHLESHGLYDYRNRLGEMHLTADTASGSYSIQIIETGTRIYISLPAELRQHYQAAWLSTDLDAFSQALGSNETLGPNLNALYAFDGAHQITQRAAFATGQVQLHATISLADARAAIGSDKAPLLKAAFNVYGPGTTVTGTAALDSNGYIRSATLDGSAGNGRVSLHQSLTIDDINKDVPTPTRPPASATQEIDAQELAKLMRQAGQ